MVAMSGGGHAAVTDAGGDEDARRVSGAQGGNMDATMRHPPPVSPEMVAAIMATGARTLIGEPLSRHTSFRVGGPADLFVETANVAELQGVLRACHAHSCPVFFLGGGTNLLVSDRGVRGAVVRLGRSFDFVEWEPDAEGATLRVGAAVPFKRLVNETVTAGLDGLQFAEGIPGTVGGGLMMNAGAFGGEIGRVVEAVEAVASGGDLLWLPRARLNFAYRRLELPLRAIVTAVRLRLARAETATLRAAVAAAKARRERNQPRGFSNAGSIFKNPKGMYAGALIEAVGLKGARLGNAMVSERHANFVVNLGGARASDVRGLMDLAARAVRLRLGVELEPEIKLVGEW